MKHDLQSALQYVNLSDKQASLYLALLRLGTASVAEIAKESHVKRPTAYVLLPDLEKRGLIRTIQSGSKTTYIATPPSHLHRELEQQLEEFTKALPALQALIGEQAGRPQLKLYEGREQLIAAWREILRQPAEFLFISDVDAIYEQFGPYLDSVTADLRARKHPYRELIGNSPVGRRYAREAKKDRGFREIRLLDGVVESEVLIVGDEVITTSFRAQNYFAVSIQNAPIAATYRATFEQAWKCARKIR